MNEPTSTCDTGGIDDARQIQQILNRLTRRYAGTPGLHRDVIEAAIRSAWRRYGTAKVTTYRAILTERAAAAALQPWFGAPTDRDLEPRSVRPR